MGENVRRSEDGPSASPPRETAAVDVDARIDRHVAASSRLKDVVPQVRAAGRTLAEAFAQGRRAYFFGNGGSAAQAEHLAAELSGRFESDRPALPAIALSGNTAHVTAVANDYGYENLFVRSMRGRTRAGDVAVGLSTSGTSPNVVRGLRAATQEDLATIGLTGSDGGDLGTWSDVLICAPASRTAQVQELHLTCGHLFCAIVEQALFGTDDRGEH